MFRKRDFPKDFTIPKDIKFWCGLKLVSNKADNYLDFEIITQNEACFKKRIIQQNIGLFDFSDDSYSDKVYVDGRSFFESIQSTNSINGFDMDIKEDEVKIIGSKKKSILKTVKLKDLELSFNEIILTEHTLVNPNDLKSISCITSVHKTAQDDTLSRFLSNLHIHLSNDSIEIWATYGGIWHTVCLKLAESDISNDLQDISWMTYPYWIKDIGCFDDIDKISIKNNQESKPYLILTGQNTELDIPIKKDDCHISFPEYSFPAPQSKVRASKYLKISERDRKIILKNIDIPNYYVLPEIWN